jgi:nucleoside-diphosphate-sugar epimerase
MAAQNELHVIFGTGAVGTAIMKELVRKGKHVRMVNRSGKVPRGVASNLLTNVEVCAGDAYSAESTRKLAEGASVVYQAAQPEYHEWPEKFPSLQAAILDGAAAAGAKLVVVENLYMYGDPNGRPITEDLPINPAARKGKVRAEMTQALMAAHKSGKVRVTMGRASDFFGPGYMVMGEQVFYPALAGKKASGLGNIDLPHSFTYTEDFGKALVILGERDESLGRAWHVPTAPPITQRELIRMIFEATGQPPQISSIGRLMMMIGGLFIPGARETVEMLYEFEKPFVVDSTHFTRTFGMEATPLRQAVQETVAWFRANPQEKH